jgi:hypothetical protein
MVDSMGAPLDFPPAAAKIAESSFFNDGLTIATTASASL